MKGFAFLVIGATGLLAAPLAAAVSVEFTTELGEEFAWDLRWSGTEWSLSFVDRAVIVDDTNPDDPTLEGDFVQLPTMVLSGVQESTSGVVTATLHPRGPLEIESFLGGNTVLSASVASGGMLSIGTNYVAYSQLNDDLDIQSFDGDYGMIIGEIASGDKLGLPVDMSFSGDAIDSINLRDLVLSNRGNAQGTLSGQITVIPEPVTVLLLGLGTTLARSLSKKKRSR